MKKLLAAVLALVMILGLAACGAKTETPAAPAAPAAPAEDAPAEPALEETGKLVIYAGALEDECIAIGEAFEAATGIDTEVVVLGGGEILARVEAESENPIAAIWWGGGIDGQMNAKDRGLLQPYFSPNRDVVAEALKDPEGYWTGVYTGYLGFVYNIARLEELGVEAPDSWEDLLDPKLKGEIVFAAPNASSTGYNVVSTVCQLWDAEKGIDFMTKLNENAVYGERGTCWIAPVTTGEAAIGLCFLQDAGDLMLNEGYGDVIGISTASEGTGYELGGVAIINNAPDLASAQKFVDWALTAEAQEIDQQYGHYVFLTNPEAKTPEAASELAKTTKLVNIDFLWAAANKADLLAKWESATGNA